ncbi:MAG TPA: helix-turn-helix domain-containing protein [Anaerolineae bacterium]|nr:helix-turn-helix domain-containing protein [Anaerolineae bacterium]
MSDEAKRPRDWLNLNTAAQRLGVHPTTLRRWADSGDIPVMLTPGGHRRFAVADLERFESKRHGLRVLSGLEQMWADQAIDRTRQELQTSPNTGWLQAFDAEEREHKRLLGRRLMGVILQYVSLTEGGEALLAEARSIGHEHAEDALKLGLSLTSALEAAMFFRDSMVEAAIHLPETAHLRPTANVQLLRRINTVLNTVQLAIAEAYEKPRVS